MVFSMEVISEESFRIPPLIQTDISAQRIFENSLSNDQNNILEMLYQNGMKIKQNGNLTETYSLLVSQTKVILFV